MESPTRDPTEVDRQRKSSGSERVQFRLGEDPDRNGATGVSGGIGRRLMMESLHAVAWELQFYH
jgi:hypothetical protein